MLDYFKKLVTRDKVHFVYGCIILVLIIGLVLCYKFLKTDTTTPPPVATITDTTPASVAAGQAAAGKYTGKDDAADVSQLIHKAQQSAPTATFTTSTQAAADKQAQTMAAKDKADYILKETKAVTKNGENENLTAENSATKSSEITNNYYAIQQERKHRLAVGATVIDSKPYATVAYTNDRLTYEIHSKDLQQIDGATVAYTIRKW